MKKIKFSHIYNKFPDNFFKSGLTSTIRLLEVLIIEKKDLSESFINYDTAYSVLDDSSDCDKLFKDKYYPLPEGKLIVLLLLSEKSNLFTTIRRWTPEKEKYYKSLRGQNLEIVIEKSD